MAVLPPIDVCVPTGKTPVRDALRCVLSALEPLNLNEEEAGRVELVLAEALNNIVEHAFPGKQGIGHIAIACAHHSDGLHLRITDDGERLPDRADAVASQASLNVNIADLPEGGFGLSLIQDLAKDIQYQRIGSENRLSMRLPVALGH